MIKQTGLTKILLIGLLMMGARLALFAQFRVVVPYIEENGKIMVEAEMNGHKGRFLVDTGAPCAVTYSFFKKLDIPPVDRLQVEDSNGNILYNTVVNLSSVKLGETSFRNLEALCGSEGDMVEAFGVDGIIGYNLMKMGLIKLDSRNRQLIFTNYDQGLGLDEADAVSLVDDPFIVRVPIKLGKELRDTVMFDCGASNFYSMSNKSFQRMHAMNTTDIKVQCEGKGALSMGAAGVEEASLKYRLIVPQFTVGDFNFSNVVSVTTDASDSRIGTGLLRYGDVVIDYLRNKFYFIPFHKGKPLNVYQKDWDVIITVNDGYLTAGMVWSDSKSGMKGGERIVEINGTRFYDKVDLYKATMSGLISMPGPSAEIVYIDSKTKKEKRVTLYCR